MIARQSFPLLFLSFLFASCTARGTQEVIPLPRATTTPIPSGAIRTQGPAQHATATSTHAAWLSTLEAISNQPTRTPIPDTIRYPQRHTTAVLVGKPQRGLSFEGALVLSDRHFGYLLRPSTNAVHPLPGGRISLPTFSWLNVSPDNRRLAYIELRGEDPEGGRLHVVDVAGLDLSIRQPPPGSTWGVVAWVKENTLLLGHDTHASDDINPHAGNPLEAAIFDTATGQVTMLPRIPYQASEGARPMGLDADRFTPALYFSPSLDRAVLTKYEQPSEFPPRNAAVIYEIWDPTSSRLVWQAKAEILYVRRPLWLDAGSRLAVAFEPYIGLQGSPVDQCATKLWLIDRAGAADVIADCAVGNFSVSPDATKIAAWLDASDECPNCPFLPSKLAVIDLQNQTVDVYIIRDPEHFIPWDQYPVWSPDQLHIAFSAEYDNETIAGTMILNLLTGDASFQTTDAWVLAWLH